MSADSASARLRDDGARDELSSLGVCELSASDSVFANCCAEGGSGAIGAPRHCSICAATGPVHSRAPAVPSGSQPTRSCTHAPPTLPYRPLTAPTHHLPHPSTEPIPSLAPLLSRSRRLHTLQGRNERRPSVQDPWHGPVTLSRRKRHRPHSLTAHTRVTIINYNIEVKSLVKRIRRTSGHRRPRRSWRDLRLRTCEPETAVSVLPYRGIYGRN